MYIHGAPTPLYRIRVCTHIHLYIYQLFNDHPGGPGYDAMAKDAAREFHDRGAYGAHFSFWRRVQAALKNGTFAFLKVQSDETPLLHQGIKCQARLH